MARKRQAPGPGAPHLQANVAELRALAHPLRLRIMELFAESPKTTKHVAQLLGQPPTRLYHHVAALERAGLLRLKETRKNRGTVEKWYEAISRTFGSAAESKRARGVSPAAKRAVAMTVLDQARREVVTAMNAKGAEPPLLARLVVSAPADQMPRVRKRLYDLLTEVQAEFDCGEPGPNTDDHDRWAMTLSFAPTWPSGNDDVRS
jgi:DNA-binding transcriptional ArsR family regulator